MYGLGICLLLTGLLVLDSLFALVAAVFWRSSCKAIDSWSAGKRARFLFLLRVAPGLGAIGCVGTLVTPAFFANEPRETTEVVTIKLALLALIPLCAIGVSLWRVIATWVRTRRLVSLWLEKAEPIPIEHIAVPAYIFRHPFPVLAIVGTIRPKLFIAGQVFQALDPEELSAAIAHENGHLTARDTVKGGLIRACRDLFAISPPGHMLARAWTEAAEAAADEYAAGEGKAVALNLASALVKVARLAPRDTNLQDVPAAAFLIAEDMGRIAARVRRLSELTAQPSPERAGRKNFRMIAFMGALAGFISSVVLISGDFRFLASIHWALERLVSALQ